MCVSLENDRFGVSERLKWIFFDLGATLVDESDVYKSRCEFAIKQLNITSEEFMNKVYEEAR